MNPDSSGSMTPLNRMDFNRLCADKATQRSYFIVTHTYLRSRDIWAKMNHSTLGRVFKANYGQPQDDDIYHIEDRGQF